MRHKSNGRSRKESVRQNLLKDRKQRLALEAALAVVLLANFETGCSGSSTSLPAQVTAAVQAAQSSCSGLLGTTGYCDCMFSSLSAAISASAGSMTPSQVASANSYNSMANSSCVQSAGMTSFSQGSGDPWWS